MTKIKHLKVNGLVMQDLKHFNFKKLFKNTLALSLLVLSLNASAAWHKASGVGTSRNDAVNDAIRNVMLEAGADVRILQSFKDGQIVSSNMDVRGANPIKELVVLEEQSTNNTVTIFDLNEIEAIKPQYLNLYINKCMAVLDKAVNGTITSADISPFSNILP